MEIDFSNNRIFELRKEKNLSQKELANLIDTSQANLSRWEKNLIVPSIVECWKLAEYFGVSIDYLCGKTDD